jgi:hypothetical protein
MRAEGIRTNVEDLAQEIASSDLLGGFSDAQKHALTDLPHEDLCTSQPHSRL